MKEVIDALSDLVTNVVAFVVMLVLAILSFYFTVFVVRAGAGLAGMTPSADFVVLSATLLAVAAIYGAAVSPGK